MTIAKFIPAALVALMLLDPALADNVAVEGLRDVDEPAGEEMQCTEDGVWCIVVPIVDVDEIRSTGGPMRVFYGRPGAMTQIASIEVPPDDTHLVEYKPWYVVVRYTMPEQPETALVGIMHTERRMYAGGGSNVSWVTLYEVRSDRPDTVREVVKEMPWASHVGIKACFDEDDATRRQDACQDEYEFSVQLGADQTASLIDPPRMIVRTQAKTYPGPLGRGEDSTTKPPLTPADLVWTPHAECTVTRTLTRNPGSGSWDFDQPLPACSDFLEP